jgi:hypothetical protein
VKTRVCPENADFTYQFADNYQNYGDVRGTACHVKTILHQRTDWAIVMLVEVVVMVLGDREYARHYQCNDMLFKNFTKKSNN